MDLLVVDFETYYAKDYGLRKLTTEEYIIKKKLLPHFGFQVQRNR
jgi:hypothetical protein